MPKKKEENVLSKKDKENLKNTILEEINETVKPEIVNDVATSIKTAFNEKYKEEIKNEVKSEISKELELDFKRDKNKLIRRKNFKIFRMTIYLILLLAILLLIIYKLFITNNLNLISSKLSKLKLENDNRIEYKVEKEEEITKDLAYYKNLYSYLVDDLSISNIDILSVDLNDLSVDQKLSIAYNSLSSKDKSSSGIIYYVNKDKLLKECETIFGELKNYNNDSFTVNNLTFVYSAADNQYLAILNGELNNGKTINDIYEIKENDNNIEISCYLAYIKNNLVYNINNLEEDLTDYNNFESFDKSVLPKVKYTFTKTNDNFILTDMNVIE